MATQIGKRWPHGDPETMTLVSSRRAWFVSSTASSPTKTSLFSWWEAQEDTEGNSILDTEMVLFHRDVLI